ncbi:MAG: hypothetical protein A2Y62_10960 [Candidatus Fischerbacteria bacterium RBG_13_37_8]|uniref:J domain-containing protein n=1 Tax=Candidatus Fischerbacteria bacterium RBG_13_37_8 TaxID=1817863 RepID=A0A1F5VUP5_9BACT|nr:MAG: hypothetical protein A2Y62_10960 [Candidatus Fischerbacteria bacterium RBG_13_37_8]
MHRIFPDYQEKPNLNEGSWGRLMLIQPNPQESFILSRIDGELTVEDLLSICPFAEEDILGSLFAFQSCNIITMQKAVGKLFRLGVEVAEMFSGKEIPLAQTSDEFFELFAELDDKYKEITKGDYYDVLDVQQNASLSQIKSSYYQLAKKFHPDRYSTLADAAAREKLSFVFSKITEAYQILEGNREAYDNKLKEAKVPKMKYDEAKVEHEVIAEKKEFVKDPDRAEKLLERGKMEFILGHYLEGIRLFREAYINDPDSPMVLRILGKNVARYPQWRKEAEDYLNKAVGMEPTNAENYYELGCLYQKFGFYYKARSKFWIALKYDPYNKETLNALASLPLDVKFPEEQKKDIFAKIKDKLSKLLGR